MAKVLGLSFFFHDSAASLVIDGKVVAAVAEERLCRRKHTNEFPQLAIEYCLEQSGLASINDIDAIVFYEKPITKLFRILEAAIYTWPRSGGTFIQNLPNFLKNKINIRKVIQKKYPKYKGYILFNQHHLSHAASAFYPSPYDEAAIITLDGVGEWDTASIGFGSGNKIRIDRTIHFPHSVGLLYSALTAYLGFRVNDGEWKVMGLAPYGDPVYVDQFRELVQFRDDGSFCLNMEYFSHHWSNKTSYEPTRWESLFGFPPRSPDAEEIPKRYEDLARSGQVVVEELICRVAREARKEYDCPNLVIAGGVGLNSCANWRIQQEGIFDEVWIQPAAGDDGGALGAALYVDHQLEDSPRHELKDVYLGPEFGDEQIREFLESRDIPHRRLDDEELVSTAAQCIIDGQVIGWFQGRMEFGPRSLGNRSILAGATDPEMKAKINSKIKFREYFRPFAPAVPLESVHEYFEVEENTALPFMLKIPSVRDEAKGLLPAVTHEDGSARVQTVSEDVNPLYYRIMKALEASGVAPVVVNTSFNVRGEPVVCTPYDAYSCYANTGIDTLFLGNFLIEEKQHDRIDFDAQFERSNQLESRIGSSGKSDIVDRVMDSADGTIIDTRDPRQVLRFYKSLPFNFYSNATEASLDILRGNQIREYPDLVRVLEAGQDLSVLDVGCGAAGS
jgi:carbamoyltransferase